MKNAPIRHAPGPTNAIELRPRDEITGSYVDPSQPLIWRRSMPRAPDFELRQGKTVFGEMEPASETEMDATGECLGRALELCLEISLLRGFRVESRVSMEDQQGPGFQGRFLGWGRITTPQGETLRWRHGLWRLYDHALFDSHGQELLRLRPAFLRFIRTETRVIVKPGGWARSDLAELLLLTWFLRAHVDARGRQIFKKSRKRLGRDSP